MFERNTLAPSTLIAAVVGAAFVVACTGAEARTLTCKQLGNFAALYAAESPALPDYLNEVAKARRPDDEDVDTLRALMQEIDQLRPSPTHAFNPEVSKIIGDIVVDGCFQKAGV